MESWSGLGYYARARNLHALAKTVAPRGEPNSAIPSDPEALRALPGVGAYTAGAVASFAYERRAALVDTNVARVLGRVFLPGVNVKKGPGHRQTWALAERLLPRTGKAAWVHNQALMELGALVCTARVMRCGSCPVRSVCGTYAAAESSTLDSSRAARAPSSGRARSSSPTPAHRAAPRPRTSR
jgi:A/G-specific adenine glycosylase